MVRQGLTRRKWAMPDPDGDPGSKTREWAVEELWMLWAGVRAWEGHTGKRVVPMALPEGLRVLHEVEHLKLSGWHNSMSALRLGDEGLVEGAFSWGVDLLPVGTICQHH